MIHATAHAFVQGLGSYFGNLVGNLMTSSATGQAVILSTVDTLDNPKKLTRVLAGALIIGGAAYVVFRAVGTRELAHRQAVLADPNWIVEKWTPHYAPEPTPLSLGINKISNIMQSFFGLAEPTHPRIATESDLTAREYAFRQLNGIPLPQAPVRN